ncbi:MAG TPA: hypothetical protein VMW27_00070 [Thermoanaerobaculia bacterium]|nr:hypothetical protein [Thermoanaerobaculia bacterium]
MREEQKQHLSLVNPSGFPFQIAVAAHIRSLNTAWRVIRSEQPWRHPETGRDGYIDLVLENGIASSQRLVVECKKQRGDVRWYFLDPQAQTCDVSYLLTKCGAPNVFVDHGSFTPASHEAPFCMLPREDPSRRPTLEQLADELLQAVEALALEELRSDPAPVFQYLPVVVTNAQLFICSADPMSISLTTGELPEDAAFDLVPFVRFRKTLWSGRATEAPDFHPRLQPHHSRERTIIVVSAASLRMLLSNAHFGRS